MFPCVGCKPREALPTWTYAPYKPPPHFPLPPRRTIRHVRVRLSLLQPEIFLHLTFPGNLLFLRVVPHCLAPAPPEPGRCLHPFPPLPFPVPCHKNH